MVERLYLDSCVLNRAADDQSQERVRLETLGIAAVFDLIVDGEAEWVASSVLREELSRAPDAIRRGESLQLLLLARTFVRPDPVNTLRAQELMSKGLRLFDAFASRSGRAGGR